MQNIYRIRNSFHIEFQELGLMFPTPAPGSEYVHRSVCANA